MSDISRFQIAGHASRQARRSGPTRLHPDSLSRTLLFLIPRSQSPSTSLTSTTLVLSVLTVASSFVNHVFAHGRVSFERQCQFLRPVDMDMVGVWAAVCYGNGNLLLRCDAMRCDDAVEAKPTGGGRGFQSVPWIRTTQRKGMNG